MKAELTFPSDLVDMIADRVIEKLLPVLKCHSQSEDKYLTVRQLAEYTGYSMQWIYNNKSKIPHIFRKRKPLFKRSEIDAWLSEYRSEPEKSSHVKQSAFKQRTSL